MSKPPAKYRVHGQTVFFPQEIQSKGTWIATSENLFTLCLLNGADQKHEHMPPYKKSRGLVLLDFFLYNNVDRYAFEYDFKGVEPFTLIIVDCNNERRLHQLKWDGKMVSLTDLKPFSPYIWSSATLYTDEERAIRNDWFNEFLTLHPYITIDNALFFHHFGGKGYTDYAIIMQRSQVQTISITAIEATEHSKHIIYEDLIDKKCVRCHVY